MVDGNNNHQAVNIPGKAIPRVIRIPKIADTSDIGTPFLGVSTGHAGKKLQGSAFSRKMLHNDGIVLPGGPPWIKMPTSKLI
jgi:hypothetical protein